VGDRRIVGSVQPFLPDRCPASAWRPGTAREPGLPLAGDRRPDVGDEQRGIVGGRRVGLLAGLHRGRVPDLLDRPVPAVHWRPVPGGGADDPVAEWRLGADRGGQRRRLQGRGRRRREDPEQEHVLGSHRAGRHPVLLRAEPAARLRLRQPDHQQRVDGPGAVGGRGRVHRLAVAVHARLRSRPARERDRVLLQHPDELLRREQRLDRDRRLHAGRDAGQDRVRAAGRRHLRGHARGPGDLHHQRHRARGRAYRPDLRAQRGLHGEITRPATSPPRPTTPSAASLRNGRRGIRPPVRRWTSTPTP
jgi:hypothetical protein